MDWMMMPLHRYADFSGRSRRKEYWMFFLGITILYAIVGFMIGVGGAFSGSGDGIGALGILGIGLFAIVALALLVPSIAVQVRRFHDQDRTGWWVLIAFVPYLGGLILLVFMCIEGTRGDNRYGPDPKSAGGF